MLAGGDSRRMGTDKAFLELGGQPVLSRILNDTLGEFSDIVLVANRHARYRDALEASGWVRLDPGIDRITDQGAADERETFTRGDRRVRLLGDRRPQLVGTR